jgi:hypothetical protein
VSVPSPVHARACVCTAVYTRDGKLGQMEVSSSFRAATASGNQFANAILSAKLMIRAASLKDLALSLRFDEDIATNFA